MSLPSLPGLEWGNPRSLIIGSGDWLLNGTVLRSWYLVGPSTGRAPAAALRPRTNLLTLPLFGLGTQIQGSGRLGRKVKDWPSSSQIVGPCWFWTVLSRCKIRLVQEREGYGTLLSRLFSASLQLSIPGFA